MSNIMSRIFGGSGLTSHRHADREQAVKDAHARAEGMAAEHERERQRQALAHAEACAAVITEAATQAHATLCARERDLAKSFLEVDEWIRRSPDEPRKAATALLPLIKSIDDRCREELGSHLYSARLATSYAKAAGQLDVVGNPKFFGAGNVLGLGEAVLDVASKGSGPAAMTVALLALEVGVEEALRQCAAHPSAERAQIFVSHVSYSGAMRELNEYQTERNRIQREEAAREQESFQREAQAEQADVALAAAERARSEPWDR